MHRKLLLSNLSIHLLRYRGKSGNLASGNRCDDQYVVSGDQAFHVYPAPISLTPPAGRSNMAYDPLTHMKN